MLSFRTMTDVAQARIPPPLRELVSRLVRGYHATHGDRYDPEADGYVLLFEPGSTDDQARSVFGHTWADAPVEGVSYNKEYKVFLAIVMLNNQLAHTVIVPDQPWLPADFRSHLLENLCGEGPP